MLGHEFFISSDMLTTLDSIFCFGYGRAGAMLYYYSFMVEESTFTLSWVIIRRSSFFGEIFTAGEAWHPAA